MSVSVRAVCCSLSLKALCMGILASGSTATEFSSNIVAAFTQNGASDPFLICGTYWRNKSDMNKINAIVV